MVSLVIAPAFSFNSPFFVSPPPRHAGGTQEVSDGGLPCHSAFFVSPPRHAGGTREVLTVVCLIIVSAFPSITFLRVFPGFIARPFRRVGVGYEEPHLRLMF